MEKGFNDDELADIMNEIESLEKEFSSDDDKEQTEKVETQSVEAQEHTESEQVQANSSEDDDEDSLDGEMEEVLNELSHMPIEDVVPSSKVEEQTEERDENIHHLHERTPMSEKRQSNNQTAMSFHVEGDMKFELSFHISGKFVGLTVTEEGLEIGLDGGAKFTVPLEHSSSSKKAS